MISNNNNNYYKLLLCMQVTLTKEIKYKTNS